ncbi:hypothetical protein [Aliarcobacter cryaerophilus]|uniref:hypothetical protein n=1 Tax=Aliarcobacter cryaerophilus TaxID=28198 RepID=UPI003DA29DC5
MKGTIIDFDETEKVGLILSDDGNRYEFDLSQWKSKNKTPELDNEVDFVINEDKVCDIYSLNKANDVIKTKNNNDLQNHFDSDIKKINFTEIENKVDDELKNGESFNKERDELKKGFLWIVLPVLAAQIIFLAIAFSNRWDSPLLMLPILTTFLTMLFAIFLAIRILIPRKLFNIIVKNSNILTEYEKQLKIINYTPSNLNFENIKIINVSGDTLEEATKELLKQAYELKADAIINYSNQFNTISSVSTTGFGSAKRLSTSVTTVNTLSGLAIKVKE